MTEGVSPAVIEASSGPLVSVVLPVYNGEQYLAEAIDSILAQSYANFELIIIDDGSGDTSELILRAYEKLDARVRVIVRENRGLATTLNDAIGMAQGEWIARMDQDDIALPHRLERQLAWLERTGADISGSWVQYFGATYKRVKRWSETDAAIKVELLFRSPFAHPTVMMRTRLARQLNYDKAWDAAEDYDLWERAAEAGWTMANVPEVLLLYRVHAPQISAQSSERQQQLGQEIRRRYWRFLSESLQLNHDLIDEMLKVFNSPIAEVDMNAVEAAFAGLLRHIHAESRHAAFQHVTQVYFNAAAAGCWDIVPRWSKLNKEFGEGWGLSIKMKLWLFLLFRIRSGSTLFKRLKRLYMRRVSW